MPTLSITEEAYRHLAARAVEKGTTVDELATRLLVEGARRSAADLLLDAEYHAECADDTDAVPTLAKVRAVTAKLTGSLAAHLVAERDER